MDKFKRLKRIVEVDKPVFAKANPNDPIMYKLKQKPGMNIPPVPEEEPEEQFKLPDVDVPTQDDVKGIVSKFRRFGQPEEPESVVREGELQDPERAADDEKAFGEIFKDLITRDTDETLDELDALNEYDLSEKDKRLMYENVMEHLRRSGKIDNGRPFEE